MTINTVHVIGMSPNESLYGEPVAMPDGSELSITLEAGEGEVFGAAFTFSGALAVRYWNEELEQLGNGSVDAGIMSVAGAIRLEPELYGYGQPRPFESDLQM